MADFLTPVDIANRALQQCGASRITAFTDDSKNASAVSFVYDKLRKAELRRNVWKFSIRKAIIRAIDTNTLELSVPAWAAGAYQPGDIVSYLGTLWLAPVATSGIPGTSGWLTYAGPRTVHLHDPDLGYGVGELVYLTGAPTVVYMSTDADNDTTPPGATWLQINATTTAISILEPAESVDRFLFMLPANFLRYAPDPKKGAFSVLGGPAGNAYQDLNFEGRYISGSDPYPILMRFAADIADVTGMDTMFCEGLASRIALGVVEELTQSATKLSTLAQVYKQFMSEARMVNAIEVGPMEPDEDDYISVRR